MPSYLRLLTEKASEITTPPTGHTAVWTSSGESTYDQYDLYIKNPEGFIYKLGGTGSTVSYGNSTFYSGITVYSGGYTVSGSPTVALAFNGDLSATTSAATLYIGNIAGSSPMNFDNVLNASNPIVGLGDGNHTARFNFNQRTEPNWYGSYLGIPNSDNGIAVHIPSGTTGLTHAITLSGSMSGTNSVAFGLNQTSNHGFAASGTALYTAVFNSGNTVSNSGATAFGSGNTSSGPVSFSMGADNTASGQASFASGSGNTSSGYNSISVGAANVASGYYSFAGGSASTASQMASFSFGFGNSVSTSRSTAFGSGTTASGNTNFVIGNKNIMTGLFVIGNGSDGVASNIVTTRQSGITISQSGGTNPEKMTNGVNQVAALAVMSGSGSQPLGFKLPLIELHTSGAPVLNPSPGSATNSWATLTGSTGSNSPNKGLMFWDGNNIRVYTGTTWPYYATLATQGGGGSL